MKTTHRGKKNEWILCLRQVSWLKGTSRVRHTVAKSSRRDKSDKCIGTDVDPSHLTSPSEEDDLYCCIITEKGPTWASSM